MVEPILETSSFTHGQCSTEGVKMWEKGDEGHMRESSKGVWAKPTLSVNDILKETQAESLGLMEITKESQLNSNTCPQPIEAQRLVKQKILSGNGRE